MSKQPPWKLNRVYPAVVVLGALVTHLASEFFGMGADADAQILLSRRHIYLALAALACGVIIYRRMRSLVIQADGLRDFKRLVSNGIEELPWGGGWRFYTLTAILQFAIGIGSAVGEGCFFCGDDAVFGVAGALLTTVLLGLVFRLIACRLPKFASQLAAMLLPRPGESEATQQQIATPALSGRLDFWSLQLANRPPPLHFASSIF